MPGASEFEDRITWTELLRKVPPAEWVLEMIRYRQLHGRYRASDLDRLLGPINKCVEWPPRDQRLSPQERLMAKIQTLLAKYPATETPANGSGIDFGPGEGI